MANSRAGNVLRIDTTVTFSGESICTTGIKYIAGGGTGSVTINEIKDEAAGDAVYEASGTLDVFDEAQMVCKQGVAISVVAPAVCYLYLK